MHAGDLFEAFASFSPEAAARWVDAALAESAALRVHDDLLYPASRDPEQLRVAHGLHAAWTLWADDAERLLNRLKLLPESQPVPRAGELFRAVGRARAMLQLTPEIMLKRQEQVERGEVLTLEEVRRELRLANRG